MYRNSEQSTSGGLTYFLLGGVRTHLSVILPEAAASMGTLLPVLVAIGVLGAQDKQDRMFVE